MSILGVVKAQTMSLVRPIPIAGTPGSYAPLITRFFSFGDSAVFVHSRT